MLKHSSISDRSQLEPEELLLDELELLPLLEEEELDDELLEELLLDDELEEDELPELEEETHTAVD